MIRHVCIIAAVLQRCASLAPKTVERRSALAALASSLAAPAHAKSYQSGLVFEGGAGGLTKTKPNTGVKQAVGAVDDERPKTTPAGPVAARLAGRKGLPVDVAFDAPFPTTPGLVSRDYQTGDGAYVLVAPAKGALKKVVSDKIFAADGKYGSYGAPSEVRLKESERRGDGDEVFEYTFVALTPARRGVRTRTRRGRRVDGVGKREKTRKRRRRCARSHDGYARARSRSAATTSLSWSTGARPRGGSRPSPLYPKPSTRSPRGRRRSSPRR